MSNPSSRTILTERDRLGPLIPGISEMLSPALTPGSPFSPGPVGSPLRAATSGPDVAPPEILTCRGSLCQGQIEHGYCARHAPLAAIDERATSPMPPKITADDGKDDGKSKTKHAHKPSLVEFTEQKEHGKQTLENFLMAVHRISGEIEPHKAAEMIIQETCRLLEAERATLFYVDGDELILAIAKGARNIRLPKSRGIAGIVATTGETLNIQDAYAHPKFDQSHDLATGFRTRNILATAIRDSNGEVMGVLQCINKIRGDFTRQDEVIIQNLAFHCSVVLRNAGLYETAQAAEARVSSLLEMIEMLNSDPSINSLIFTLSQRAHQLVNADRSTLYLADRDRNQLVVMQGDIDIRIPLNKSSLAGVVACTGQVVNIPDCYKDERFNRTVDQKTGYRTKTMLCMPIPAGPKTASAAYIVPPSPTDRTPPPTFAEVLAASGHSGQHSPVSASRQSSGSTSSSDEREHKSEMEVVGVLQLINKLDDSTFDKSDEQIIATLLKIAGPLIKRAGRLFVKKAPSVADTIGEAAAIGMTTKGRQTGSPKNTGSPAMPKRTLVSDVSTMNRITEID